MVGMSRRLGGLTRQMFCLDRRTLAIHPRGNDPLGAKEPDASQECFPIPQYEGKLGSGPACVVPVEAKHQPASAAVVSKTCPRNSHRGTARQQSTDRSETGRSTRPPPGPRSPARLDADGASAPWRPLRSCINWAASPGTPEFTNCLHPWICREEGAVVRAC